MKRTKTKITRAKTKTVPIRTTCPKKEKLEPNLKEQVYAILKTCYDPEIPVNIVDLGLIYDVVVKPADDGTNKVKIFMTLTSPACSMGPMIAENARQMVLSLPKISAVDVEFVFDPPWDKSRISQEAQLELGLI